MTAEELCLKLQACQVPEDSRQDILEAYLQLSEFPPNPLAWAKTRLRWLKLNEYRARVGRRGAGGKNGYGHRIIFQINEALDGGEPEQLRRAEARQELRRLDPVALQKHLLQP